MEALNHAFYAMGSDCLIHLVGEARAIGEAAMSAHAEVSRLEAKYSRFRNDSFVRRLNTVAASGGSMGLDKESLALIAFAKEVSALSNGAFDITARPVQRLWRAGLGRPPSEKRLRSALECVGLDKIRLSQDRIHFLACAMELDLGGLVKEYAADRAAEMCASKGVHSGWVNLAGDVRVIGPQPNGAPWPMALRAPPVLKSPPPERAVTKGGLATSGDYERFLTIRNQRYSHIIDPRTGRPSFGLSSVTVFADTSLLAGSLSTSAMALGQAGEPWLAALGVDYIAIDDAGRMSTVRTE